MLLPLQLNLSSPSVPDPDAPIVRHLQAVALVGRLSTCVGVVGRVPTVTTIAGVL